MKRYYIVYLREGDPSCTELHGHIDADDMIKALKEHRLYWKKRNVEVRHIECRETILPGELKSDLMIIGRRKSDETLQNST